MNNNSQILSEIKQASQAWIEQFNAGNAQDCANTYTEQAVMRAQPFGTFTGRPAILEFWTNLIASGASTLCYENIQINILDDTSAILSANWSMNIGRGIITKELWQKQDNQWFLQEDDFEVQEQFS